MSRGKRYNGERKLNMKKVFAVIITFALIIAFIIGLIKILKADKQTVATKNIELHYYTLFSNGNWGVINSSGDIIVEPAYAEMIIIPNKSKPVFVCTYEVNYVDGSYKTKIINDSNQEIFAGYENYEVIQNHNENNELWIENNSIKVQKNGKFGLINLDGSEILPCEYDSISVLKGVKNSLIIKKDGKTGLANSNGTIIVPAEYADVTSVTDNYDNGYIVKSADNKFGVINTNGQFVLECNYDDIKQISDNNMYVVKMNGKWKVIADNNTSFLEGQFTNAVDINNAELIVKEKGKYGVLNIQNETKIPFEYENLVYMFEDKYIAKKDNKYGIINTNNELLVEFKYTNIEYNKSTDYIKAMKEDNTYDYLTKDLSVKLSAEKETVLNGYISVKTGNEVKYYNYNLEEKSNKEVYPTNTIYVSKQNGKYGFVNKDGKVVVEHVYDFATEQNEYGFSAIKKDGKWGAIDQYGNVVVEPTYVLDSNEVINFIGKWHVCADLNANYYTDAK